MKLLHYNKLRLLTEKEDEHKNRVPFRMVYVTKDGNIIDADDVVTTSVQPRRKRRNVKYTEAGQEVSRTIRDCLVMQVDDTRIISS